MRVLPILSLLCLPALVFAQESKPWLESQNLEAISWKSHQEFEAVAARVKGSKDAVDIQERVILFKQGKPVWQSSEKEGVEAASRLTLHSLGRDLDGDGQPELHFSAFSGGAHCCTTHFVYKVKPAVKRHAVYAAKNVGGTDFIEIPGRKAPVMVSADDTSAYVFAPYSNSYFPVLVLEVSPKGRFQFAQEFMRAKLPGEAPPICAQAAATANPWLKDRCGEFTSAKRKARTQEIQAKLREIKGQRASDKLKWDDYAATGVLVAVAAEMNRYAYTGFGAAGGNWLETVWPGNDAVKGEFLAKLRETRAKSAFAEDLRVLSTDTR